MIGDTRPTTPIVLSCETWHQGVIGIAASRLTEAFNVPAVMICLDGDKGKGSCRSCGGFNLFEALSACSEYLEGFGGHALAAGLTIKRENIPAFEKAIGEYYLENPGEGEKTLDIDLCVDSPELLTMNCVEDLELLEPCGTGNARASLCMTRAYLSSLTPIGGGRHLRLTVEKFGHSFECVFFSRTAHDLGIRSGDWVDIAFFPQINEFRSRRSVQLLLSDLRPHKASLSDKILRGEFIPCAETAAPSREELGNLWRSIVHCGQSVTMEKTALLERLAPKMWDSRVCIGLKVFEELGLISLSFDGVNISVSCLPFQGKVNLEDSEILKSLG